MPWTKDEIDRIAKSDDFHIAPYREDGETPGTPTYIWSVVVDEQVYVRAYSGTSGRWYRAASAQKAGRVTVAGMDRKVAFEPVSGPVNDAIDAAYRSKYADSQYLEPMLSGRARAASVRVTPED